MEAFKGDELGPYPETEAGPRYSLWELAGYFLRLGTIGSGGPVALAQYMRRDLVEQRRWIEEADYMEAAARDLANPP